MKSFLLLIEGCDIIKIMKHTNRKVMSNMKTQLETSQSFKTVREFNRIYKEMRLQILERHGHKQGDKVKLVRAVQLLQSFDGGENYMPFSMVKGDMVDQIGMYEIVNKDNVSFKLKALV